MKRQHGSGIARRDPEGIAERQRVLEELLRADPKMPVYKVVRIVQKRCGLGVAYPKALQVAKRVRGPIEAGQTIRAKLHPSASFTGVERRAQSDRGEDGIEVHVSRTAAWMREGGVGKLTVEINTEGAVEYRASVSAEKSGAFNL
jgi:hypothetical protein